MAKINLGHLKRDNLKPKKEDKKKVTEVKGNKLLPQEIDVNFEISEDKNINEYLVLKSKELIGIQANARLDLGRIFQDVHDKLSGNKHTGLYVNWLSVNGYNKMTALRHRNRYELYKEISSDKGKVAVATSSQRIIDSLVKSEERSKIIDSLNDGEELKQVLEIAESQIVVEEVENEDVILETRFIDEYKTLSKRLKKIELVKIEEKDRKKIEKMMEKLNRILEKFE